MGTGRRFIIRTPPGRRPASPTSPGRGRPVGECVARRMNLRIMSGQKGHTAGPARYGKPYGSSAGDARGAAPERPPVIRADLRLGRLRGGRPHRHTTGYGVHVLVADPTGITAAGRRVGLGRDVRCSFKAAHPGGAPRDTLAFPHSRHRRGRRREPAGNAGPGPGRAGIPLEGRGADPAAGRTAPRPTRTSWGR